LVHFSIKICHLVTTILTKESNQITIITLPFPKLSSAYTPIMALPDQKLVVPRHYRHIGLRHPCPASIERRH